MSTPAAPHRTALRVLLLVLGFAITVAGVCLVAFASSTRLFRIGFPIALWGAFIAYAANSSPWLHGVPGRRGAVDTATAVSAGGELAVRPEYELDRASDVAARREYELRLELLLRREMERVLREHLHDLRGELAGLRGDVVGLRGGVDGLHGGVDGLRGGVDGLRGDVDGLRGDVDGLRSGVLDSMDGRLRLERVETTRIIGSDLAALQSEVRRLNDQRSVPEPLMAAISAEALPAELSAVPSVLPAVSSVLPAVSPTRAVERQSSAPIVRSEPASAASEPTQPRPTAASTVSLDADPFAGLPRLSAFTSGDREVSHVAAASSSPAPGSTGVDSGPSANGASGHGGAFGQNAGTGDDAASVSEAGSGQGSTSGRASGSGDDTASGRQAGDAAASGRQSGSGDTVGSGRRAGSSEDFGLRQATASGHGATSVENSASGQSTSGQSTSGQSTSGQSASGQSASGQSTSGHNRASARDAGRGAYVGRRRRP